jgi:hypothetical protein
VLENVVVALYPCGSGWRDGVDLMCDKLDDCEIRDKDVEMPVSFADVAIWGRGSRSLLNLRTRQQHMRHVWWFVEPEHVDKARIGLEKKNLAAGRTWSWSHGRCSG